MQKLTLLLAVCLLPFSLTMGEIPDHRAAVDEPISPGHRISVLQYLRNITGKQVVAGIHNREPNSRPSLQTDQLHRLTGKYPALWSGDFLFSADDINSRWAMIYECKNQWDQGSIVQLMLHVGPPNQPQSTTWEGGVLSHYTDAEWADLVTDGGHLNRLWKGRLDEYAKYLQYLSNYGVEILFRPFHEMNQSRFWWGGRRGPGGTAKLYQLTRNYLEKEKGLLNLIWVWDMQDMSRDFAEYNPGSDYWDIFAFDIYADGWARKWYDYIVPLVNDKPMIVGECSKLPSPDFLATQTRWCGFMSWAELTFTDNTSEQIQALYASEKVITRDELPGFKKAESGQRP